ncbi:MAG: hypothetical protein SFV22_07885, partial [Saprospiraceae bacterium]|nr:hypothetical protein [Saprospiraceae bacterium]
GMAGTDDYWVIKLLPDGTIHWQNTIGGNSIDELSSIELTYDNGYILAGTSRSDATGDKTEGLMGAFGKSDYWVMRLFNDGTIDWQNTIGGSDNDQARSVVPIVGGGYLVGGSSISNVSGDKTENSLGGDDYWILKLSSTGSILWQNTIGGDNTDKTIYVDETSDGGFVVGGISFSNASGDKTEPRFGNDFDWWIVKINSTGTIGWNNTIGGSEEEDLSAVLWGNGGFYLAGSSRSNISGDKTENSKGLSDIWVVRLSTPSSSNDVTGCCSTPLNLFPNPASQLLQVDLSSIRGNSFSYSLFGIEGSQIHACETYPTDGRILPIPLAGVPAGLYILRINNEYGELFAGKVLVVDR